MRAQRVLKLNSGTTSRGNVRHNFTVYIMGCLTSLLANQLGFCAVYDLPKTTQPRRQL